MTYVKIIFVSFPLPKGQKIAGLFRTKRRDGIVRVPEKDCIARFFGIKEEPAVKSRNNRRIVSDKKAVRRRGLMVKRLRRRPLKAESGVRFSVGLP